MTPTYILIVEDDPGVCQLLIALLSQQYPGVQITSCARIHDAHNVLMHESPWDLVIVDGHLKDGDGAQLVECIVKAWGGPPFLGISGDPTALEELGMAGCRAVFEKPFKVEESQATGTSEIREIIGRCDRLLGKIDHLQAQFDGGAL